MDAHLDTMQREPDCHKAPSSCMLETWPLMQLGRATEMLVAAENLGLGDTGKSSAVSFSMQGFVCVDAYIKSGTSD